MLMFLSLLLLVATYVCMFVSRYASTAERQAWRAIVVKASLADLFRVLFLKYDKVMSIVNMGKVRIVYTTCQVETASAQASQGGFQP